VDFEKFPFAKQVNFIDVTLNAGDCMYVPAFYYVQSKTTSTEGNQESMILYQTYAPHSNLVDIMMNALEEDVMTEKTANTDKVLLKWLKKFY
jgi:hypothetical protein